MKLRRVQVSVFDYLCLHKALKILMHQHSLFYVFIIQQFFLAIFSRKKATPEKLNSPEWLLKHVLIRFINDDRNRSFEGIYLWH